MLTLIYTLSTLLDPSLHSLFPLWSADLSCSQLELKQMCAVPTDVNFIASPPSMVAAGSVVAAVQGLYLKSHDASLSSQNLTNFLSQVIRSDPVRTHSLF